MAASHSQDINTKWTWVERHCSLCYVGCMAVYSQWCIYIRYYLEL